VQSAANVTTILFTDIEGSSRLWEQDSEKMSRALAAHDALARAAVAENAGVVVKMIGDGMYAAFGDPVDALKTTVKLQRALVELEAQHQLPLRVRCGVHLGIVERRDNDLFGGPVNRAARIMGAAHGGQILVSQAVVDQVQARLPESVSLRDLGAARLRDLSTPERLYQLLHPELRQDFPALRSLEQTPNNLPQQATTFIGRERELADAKELLGGTRLLTLLGMGGMGKTRLSLQIAADLMESFPDGAWFIDLAPVRDRALVPNEVAQVLSIPEEPGRPLTQTLCAHLRQHKLLLVLDNCEHLVSACASLANAVLRAAPDVKIIATTREALRIPGEQTYPVLPLTVPDRKSGLDVLAKSEAVQLFVERVRLQKPGFVLTDRDAVGIAELCARVEGIPLALELAAARVRALSVDVIATRLDDRFRLLTGGDRTGLPRQRTLRALIDWSHELLTDAETTLFRRLAVFAGGFTLEAAEAVGHDDGPDAADVLDTLMHLVEKSLVERDAAGDRYRLLETVRQYALERLDTAGEAHGQRTRHLLFYLALAQRARPELIGPQQSEWLKRLDIERENLLAAHAWSCEADLASQHGLALVSSLRRYWIFRGLLALGLTVTLEALACASAQQATRQRCEALLDAGQVGAFMGRYDEARRYLEESLAIARTLDDKVRISAVLQPLGLALLGLGELAAARERLQEGLGLAEKLGTPREIAGVLNALAQTARAGGDLATAEPLYARVLRIGRESGGVDIIAVSLLNLAMVATGRKSHASAREMLVEVLQIVDESGLRPAAQGLLEVSAGLAASSEEWTQAVRLYGVAEAQTVATGLARDPADEAFLAPLVAMAKENLGADAFASASAAGRALDYDAAIAELRGWLERAPSTAQ